MLAGDSLASSQFPSSQFINSGHSFGIAMLASSSHHLMCLSWLHWKQQWGILEKWQTMSFYCRSWAAIERVLPLSFFSGLQLGKLGLLTLPDPQNCSSLTKYKHIHQSAVVNTESALKMQQFQTEIATNVFIAVYKQKAIEWFWRLEKIYHPCLLP